MSYIRGFEASVNFRSKPGDESHYSLSNIRCYAPNSKYHGNLCLIAAYFVGAIILIMASLHFSGERDDDEVVNYKQPIGEFILSGAKEVAVPADAISVTSNPLELVISSNSEALPPVADSTQWRDICASAPEQCAPRWINATFSALWVSPKQRVLVCPIIGNFDFLLEGIVCGLEENIILNNNTIPKNNTQPADAIDGNDSNDNNDSKRGCEAKHILRDFAHFRQIFPRVIKPWRFLTIVRHPLDRFVSLFAETCVLNNGKCYDCKANISCFLEKQHYILTNFDASLTELTPDDSIFLPQSWQCDFRQKFSIIRHHANPDQRLETADKLYHLLKRKYVPQNVLEDIRDTFNALSVEDSEPKYGIVAFLKRRILENPYLFELFIRCYHWDLIQLNYVDRFTRYNSTTGT